MGLEEGSAGSWICVCTTLGLYKGWNLSRHGLFALLGRSNRAEVKRKWHVKGGNINGSNAPASTVNKITWSRYVTLDSLISSPLLAWEASEALMLPLVISKIFMG